MPKRAIGTSPLTRHQVAVDAVLAPKSKAKRKTSSAKRSVGRPPAGLDGERVSDYKRTTLWLPAATKGQLDALSRYLGCSQWRIVHDAVVALEKTLSPADRKAMDQMLKR